MITMTIKHGKFKCTKCMNKRDELYDVPIYCTKFLKYDYSWHRIEGIRHVYLKNHLIRVKVPFDTMVHSFTSPLVAIVNWWEEKCVAKTSWKWRHKVWFVSQYNAYLMAMRQTPLEGLIMLKRQITPKICTIWHGMWPYTIWEESWNNCGNPFVESFEWK